MPQASPSPDGGVAIEWHRDDIDFIISIGPRDEPPSAYFSGIGEEWEIDDLRGPIPNGLVDKAFAALMVRELRNG